MDRIIGPNQGNEFKAISMAFWKNVGDIVGFVDDEKVGKAEYMVD